MPQDLRSVPRAFYKHVPSQNCKNREYVSESRWMPFFNFLLFSFLQRAHSIIFWSQSEIFPSNTPPAPWHVNRFLMKTKLAENFMKLLRSLTTIQHKYHDACGRIKRLRPPKEKLDPPHTHNFYLCFHRYNKNIVVLFPIIFYFKWLKNWPSPLYFYFRKNL